MKRLSTKELFHINLTDASQEEVLEHVMLAVGEKQKKCIIFTPNPEIIMYAQKHTDFQTVLNQAQINLCDGVGLYLAATFLGKPLPETITGADFMETLCHEVSKKPITVGFLGGKPGVAKRASECLVKKYPGLRVVFIAEEWNKAGFTQTNTHHIDILFVAFGFPKQEKWIVEHLSKIPVQIAMSVGGAFDYASGEVSRAPFFFRAIGFEWLYRLIRQPWRLRRQLALLAFIRLTIRERFSS